MSTINLTVMEINQTLEKLGRHERFADIAQTFQPFMCTGEVFEKIEDEPDDELLTAVGIFSDGDDGVLIVERSESGMMNVKTMGAWFDDVQPSDLRMISRMFNQMAMSIEKR